MEPHPVRSPWPYVRAAAFALLVAYFAYSRLSFLSTHYRPTFESSEMEKGAASLARSGGIADVFGPDSGPSAHLVPVYPALLCFVYRAFGVDTPAGWMAKGVMAVAFAGLALALLPRLARAGGLVPCVGLAAMAYLALVKSQIWLDTRGDWEQTAAAAYLVALMIAAIRLHDRRWSGVAGAAGWGGFLGFGALLSPSVALPAGALAMLGEFLTLREDRRRLIGRFAVAGAVAALVVAPWVYRNYRTFGTLVPLRSNLGLELYLGNNPRADGHTFTCNAEVHPHVNPAEFRRYRELGEIDYMKEKGELARAWIAANPGRFARLTGRRVLMFWFSDDIVRFEPTPAGLRRSARDLAFGLGALGGLACLFAARNPHRWIFAAGLLGPSSLYALTHVYMRYSYPIYGLKVLLTFDLAARALGAIAGRIRGAGAPAPDPS